MFIMNSNEQIHTTIVIAPDTGKIWWKKSAVETQSFADTVCLHCADVELESTSNPHFCRSRERIPLPELQPYYGVPLRLQMPSMISLAVCFP